MITAYGDDVTKRKALEGGAEALLTKPIDFVALRSEIDSRVAGAGAEVRSGSRLCENPIDAMIPLLNRGGLMKGFVQRADRQQTTLLPECLDDWADESNPVRAVDVFVDALEVGDLGLEGVDQARTRRPAYHRSPMLKLYIYGYLHRE